ncbi:MAG: hypothetical protein LCH39_13620 [Proteobacteria bacterium]|nr:hypothetical protein [Pseudomonadota bacterium]
MLHLRSLRSLIPLLAVLFALTGVANARLRGENVGVPAAFALCQGSEQSNGGHDCLDCCLPGLALATPLPALPTLWSSVAAVLAPEGRDFGLGGFGLERPLSRGPPARSAA